MKKNGFLATLILALPLLAGCDGGKGGVELDTWGEEYIEVGIPAAEFEDGWDITFTKFLIHLGHVTVADAEGNVGAKMEGTILFDHKIAGEKPVFTADDLAAGPWENVSFEAPVATPDAELAEGVTEADKQLLIDNEASVYVAGSGSKDGVTKTFAWVFPVGTVYEKCKGELDGKETSGALVTNGGVDQIQLTIHGDHFFYDDLQAENAVLRFDAIAAADDGDGDVTLDELGAVQLVDIPEGSYGTGSVGDVNDLRQFVTALSRTLGHFRGEGECFARRL